MNRRVILWGVIALAYGVFWRWYTGSGKPLTKSEIERHLAVLSRRGGDPVVLARLRAFLEADDGRDFVMVNLLKLHDHPEAEKQLRRYTSAFLSTLLKRAGHPVLAGKPAAEAVELWGVENGAAWSNIGLVRYRSRRDMIEAAANPEFFAMHPDKTAALDKTIAVPTAPWFYAGDPRLIAGLLAVILALMIKRGNHSE